MHIVIPKEITKKKSIYKDIVKKKNKLNELIKNVQI